MIKRTIFYLLVVNYLLFAEEPPQHPETYDVPSNCKFPFGDEQQINANYLDNHTNKVHCVEGKDLSELEGKCPLDPTNGSLIDPYQFCPSVPVVPPPHEIIFSSSGIPQPKLQCKKCDLKLTEDGKAIVVECFQCYDIPTTTREANKTERSILYKVYFLEIANYTTVQVVGAENLDLIN